MNDHGELRRENRSLRDRFSRLSSTVLRINSSLDLDTVLQEVVDSARALTGAAQGVITTVDAGGGLPSIVTARRLQAVLNSPIRKKRGESP